MGGAGGVAHSTAFGWAHASWDNDSRGVSRSDRATRQIGNGNRALDTRGAEDELHGRLR